MGSLESQFQKKLKSNSGYDIYDRIINLTNNDNLYIYIVTAIKK
jgi:hypothetical protein